MLLLYTEFRLTNYNDIYRVEWTLLRNEWAVCIKQDGIGYIGETTRQSIFIHPKPTIDRSLELIGAALAGDKTP